MRARSPSTSARPRAASSCSVWASSAADCSAWTRRLRTSRPTSSPDSGTSGYDHAENHRQHAGAVARHTRRHVGQRPGQQAQASQQIGGELRLLGGRPWRLEDESQHADDGEEEGADRPADHARRHDSQYRQAALTEEAGIVSPDAAPPGFVLRPGVST